MKTTGEQRNGLVAIKISGSPEVGFLVVFFFKMEHLKHVC